MVPGINAVLNAVDFGGGVLNAGSNRSSGIDLMDGRMDTFWEPDPSDLLQDWWVQIDLGRTVSATKIVLKFVGEDLGDPFLQFKVITSQGQKTLGQLLFRTRFTTDGPNKNERVFEIDLTADSYRRSGPMHGATSPATSSNTSGWGSRTATSAGRGRFLSPNTIVCQPTNRER